MRSLKILGMASMTGELSCFLASGHNSSYLAQKRGILKTLAHRVTRNCETKHPPE